MIKFKKNPEQLEKLNTLAQQKGIPLREMLLSDEHLEPVCNILYDGMPKMVRMAFNKQKFTDFYQNNRETIISQVLSE